MQRVSPRSVLKADEGLIFIPAPADGMIVGELIDFLRKMWPTES